MDELLVDHGEFQKDETRIVSLRGGQAFAYDLFSKDIVVNVLASLWVKTHSTRNGTFFFIWDRLLLPLYVSKI